MLSVIIPSRNEQGYLEQTIKAVLQAAEGEIEIIVILDGWLPDPQIHCNDDRVKFLHNQESIGQRQGINQACREAKGKYMMKLDAHCSVAKGFDVILARDCEYDMTMIPRMYNLDVTTWKPKKNKRTDYMYIGMKDNWMRTQYYQGENKAGNYKNDKMIDDTMSCMGPGFFMHMNRFWELGGCDEGHGSWGQQGIEVACKAWLSGGRLVVNKNTWFAHYFRGGGVPEGHKKGFPYSIKQKQINFARKHSHDLWLNDNWERAVRPFQWMLDKFNPPGWEERDELKVDKKQFYKHMISKNRMPEWLGVKVVKYPGDIILYQQEIFKNKPDIIIETGTYMGGSALFFASIFDLMGHGEVVTIDIKTDKVLPDHPRVTYLNGGSTSIDVLDKVREVTKGKKVMVVLDSNHHRRHVKRELRKYSDIVSKGQFLVVEDTNFSEIGKKDGPDEAVNWFLKRSNKLKQEPVEDQFIFSLNPGGWLRRV